MKRIVIDSNKSGIKLNLQDLLLFKDLFLVLAYRDFKVRYAQTFLGLFWAFLQPIMFLGIFILVFQKGLGLDHGGVPYPLLVLAGMSIWTYFSFVLSQSGSSIVGAQEIIKKIYFPRVIIPLSKALVGTVDFLVSLLLLVLFMVLYQSTISLKILWFPVFVGMGVLAALGIGILVSAMSIRYRDFQHILPFILQIGLYVSPVAYPSMIVTAKLPLTLELVYYLNPIAGIIDAIRWSLFEGEIFHPYLLISFLSTLMLFGIGRYYFSKVETVMADIV